LQSLKRDQRLRLVFVRRRVSVGRKKSPGTRPGHLSARQVGYGGAGGCRACLALR